MSGLIGFLIWLFGVLLGLFFIMGAVFDVDSIMNLTRAARQGYPMGKIFTRLLIGLAGLMIILGLIHDLFY